MTPAYVALIRQMWDRGQDTYAIARSLAVEEPDVSREVSRYVTEKANARRQAARPVA